MSTGNVPARQNLPRTMCRMLRQQLERGGMLMVLKAFSNTILRPPLYFQQVKCDHSYKHIF